MTRALAQTGAPGGLLRGLLRADVAASFSDLWYRVGPSRPSVSPHAGIIRQVAGERAWYIIEDPAGGQYYRLSESAYFFVGLLDGRRTAHEAWEACNAQLGDDAPTQRECVELLSRLQLFGLLVGDFPLAGDTVGERRRERRERRLAQRTGKGLAPVVPLLNPEPALGRLAHLIRPIFSAPTLIAWCVLVAVACYRVFVRRDGLSTQFNSVLEPANLVWIGAVILALRAWHELGHACAVKAMGGRCTEMGLIFVAYLLPFPYCDTSSAWRFPGVRPRVIVSLGGVLFESVPAALAAIAWSFMGDQDAGLVRTLLYNVMVVSGVTTLVFNLNPLLRYDGYYAMADLLGIPNLATRGQELLSYLLQRRVLRVPGVRPPAVHDAGEFWVLLTHAVLSLPYRIVVLLTIVWVLWSNPRYLGLGVLVAAVAIGAWVVWPVLKGAFFLLASPKLIGRRARAMGLVGGVLGAATLIVGVIPLPSAAYATGVVEPAAQETLRAGEAGFVREVHVAPGARVAAGEAIVTLEDPRLRAFWLATRARLEQARAEFDAAAGGDPTNLVQASRAVEHAEGEERRARERVESLVVRAGVAGVVASIPGLELASLPGRHVGRGDRIAWVLSPETMRVRCLLADRDRALVFRAEPGRELASGGPRAGVRVRGQAWTRVPARVVRVAPAGDRQVDRPALASDAGGDVLLDPTDRERATSITAQFLIEVEPTAATPGWMAGQRARVRLSAPPEPLVKQWWLRARQAIAERGAA